MNPKTEKDMETRDLKEVAWNEYGQEAYESEMKLRETMEREYDLYWQAIVADLYEEQRERGGRHE